MQDIDFQNIGNVLDQNPSVIFAYLYGSSINQNLFKDIDIAVYAVPDCDPFLLSADLKIALSEKTGIPPDVFDVRIVNQLLVQGDLFTLLYLKDVLGHGGLLVDKDDELRSSFIEAYSMKYRECEGLIAEVLV